MIAQLVSRPLRRRALGLALATASFTVPGLAQPASPESPSLSSAPAPSPARALLASLPSEGLRALGSDVLARNPQIARARHQAAAAAARAPQVAALPDPVAALSLFLLPPETRTGPQRLTLSLQQKLPWFGKLRLRERAALAQAAALEHDIEALRLDLLTKVRRLNHELAFLAASERIVEGERITLARYEQAAQARYAAGTGLQQESVRIQAQITQIDTRLLEIREQHGARLAHLNALRDRPAGTLVTTPPESPSTSHLKATGLASLARLKRPEMTALAARLAAADAHLELATKNRQPDLDLGLSYSVVEKRRDRPGRLMPPPDNGDDVLALSGAVALPVWRHKLTAEVAESQSRRSALEAERRALEAEIDRALGDWTTRLPLLEQHLELLDGVLLKQAREALRSAESAYSLGHLNAIDLLDAEVVLFEVRIAAERTRTDLANGWAELERAVAAPASDFLREVSP